MQQQQSSSDGDVGGGGDNDEKADAGGSGGAANANAASQQMTTNERIEEDLVAVSTQLGEKTGPVFVCFFASETTQRDGSETERKRAKGRIVRKKPKNPSFSHALAGSSTIYELGFFRHSRRGNRCDFCSVLSNQQLPILCRTVSTKCYELRSIKRSERNIFALLLFVGCFELIRNERRVVGLTWNSLFLFL